MAVRHIVLRPAVIVGGIDPIKQTCVIEFLDRVDGKRFTCSLPHPMAAPGWGIFAVPTVGTIVLVDMQQGERPQIIRTIPISQFSLDLSVPDNISDIGVDGFEYPNLSPGAIALQSIYGSRLLMSDDGSISISLDGTSIEYSPTSIASEKYVAHYVNTEAGRFISGPIKRDLREAPVGSEKLFDKLFAVSFDKPLTEIGKNPTLPVEPITLGIGTTNESLRNPGLVEHRSLVYEFVSAHQIGTFADELERSRDDDVSFLAPVDRRDLSRTDTFNLGLHTPNNLIETIIGTGVDIYGNIIDINRNIIDFKSAVTDLKDAEVRLDKENALLRRSIKFHFELNARKESRSETSIDILDGVNEPRPNEDPPIDGDEATQTGHSHSRLSLDIDGEGFIKLNVPASSNIGNIPLLTRYINSHNENNRNSWEFRDAARKDIQHFPFGFTETGGIDITPEYKPTNIIEGGEAFKYRTAYHDIVSTASDLLEAETATSEFIDNAIGSTSANAGGRSIHANLDGSLEVNIGRDIVDKKSIVLDLAGSMISRIGKDSSQNSIVSQLDGNVAIQVGGDAVMGEDVLTTNTFKVHVKSGNGYHKIELNEDGIFITSAPNTNLILQSEKNLVLSAKGSTLLDGETIQLFGSHTDNGDSLQGERLVLRNGKEVA